MKSINLTDKKVIFIIAMNGFRDEELFVTKSVLEKQGAEVLVASTDLGLAKGMLKGTVEVDITILEIDVHSTDALVFVGGQGSATLFENPTVLQIVKEAHEAGKIIGAICLAPMILANAGILHGKRITAFSSLEGKLREMGIDYVNEPVMVDKNIITANGPESAAEFGEKIAETLISN